VTSLAGRTALVTGASRGIGLACARTLARAGARVAMLARRADALVDAVQEVERAIAIPCDVRDDAAVAHAARRVVDEFAGPPDVLVNNAGAFGLARIDNTEPAALRQMLEVNLVAPFLFLRAFLPALRARRSGHIVMIGSVADRAIFPENGAYAASKHGVRALSEVLRAELRGTGVRATLISPGPTDTELWDPIAPDDRPGFTPRASMLRPEAVADAVLFAVTRPAGVNVDELRLSPA
jgi:NADP-dependent 3-hydroxy acid dehydrogenase YdfG